MVGENLRDEIMEVAFEQRIEQEFLSRLRRISSVKGKAVSEMVFYLSRID